MHNYESYITCQLINQFSHRSRFYNGSYKIYKWWFFPNFRPASSIIKFKENWDKIKKMTSILFTWKFEYIVWNIVDPSASRIIIIVETKFEFECTRTGRGRHIRHFRFWKIRSVTGSRDPRNSSTTIWNEFRNCPINRKDVPEVHF